MPIELKVISTSNSDGNGSFSANFRKKNTVKNMEDTIPYNSEMFPLQFKSKHNLYKSLYSISSRCNLIRVILKCC